MLQIKSLNKSFSEKQIFKNFNLELKDTDNLIISGTSEVVSLRSHKSLQV